ncbi:MAG TPA: DNA polymerase III subunit alpha [Candidatus Sulfotelmatobacter sp.]|jgi:DNA polymerase-3 subunit alpha|nr:DNA polymerase III subunit alpha [Candidatus Sulfotelmatobacter sp.]
MGRPEFVHLHVHTDYSLLDGACETTELLDEASRQKMPAVAITDHGNLFAAANFFNEASKRDVKPIIGCEVYVAKGSRHDRGEKTPVNGSDRDDMEPGTRGSNHLVLLCENLEGYYNLIKLVSAGFLEGFYYKPRIDYDLLAKHSKGLIALSACLRGAVTEAVADERYDQARENAYRLRDVFGKQNFFLEIQDQGLEIEKSVNPHLVRLSKETGIPLVATNDCHYLHHEDAHAQEVLLCIQTGKTMGDERRMKFPTDQFYFKSAAEMAQVFGELPEALQRTVDIAARCNVKIERIANPFPEFKVPEGHTAGSYFEMVVREGFTTRLPHLERLAKSGALSNPLAEYERRLTSEIQMIQKMRYEGYFLIVWDFIHYARSQGVPVGPGRGSAAGSLVSYALRITDVDPLQYNLLFERFLNPERVSMPDIDIDFCMRRRGELIEYVTQKYGRENVAQIITFGTMAAKAAIKDVGRAMDIPYSEVDRIAKMVPTTLGIELDDALKEAPQLKSAINADEKLKDLMAVALRLEGLARHASTHAAGVVISPVPLTDLVPIYKTNRDEVTTQYDMNALERIGLLKMDFLGLTTLTVLQDAVRMVEQNRGIQVDLENLALDDEATYKLFSRGDTTAIFQFESHGMRDILRRYQPTRIEDLTALNALYRPGPIQGGMIDDFINRKHGKTKVAYELPQLQEILQETYGVILYQEQVMQIANALASFSLGEADILRRAMGKKKKEEMAAQRAKFLDGCAKNKIPEKKAERIFNLMEEFAGYGFNKSHSCAYALLAYQTAYMKAHYPVEFMAALLTSETGNADKAVKYINEARGMSISILPPDVNESDLYFTPVGECIRFGLAAIKNVGENTAKAIRDSRNEQGPFRALYDFCERIEPRFLNKRVFESLIKSGAMDSVGPREAMLASVDDAVNALQRASRIRESGQHGLFGGTAAAPAAAPFELREVAPWSEEERLASEYAMLGFYVSGHPLDKYASRLEEWKVASLSQVEGERNGKEIAVAVLIVGTRPMRSKKGARWAIFTIQDMTGIQELLAFPESFARFENTLKPGTPLLLKVRVQVEEAGTRLSLQEARRIEDIVERTTNQEFRVRLEVQALTEDTLDELEKLFAGAPGMSQVIFELVSPDGTVATVASQQRVRITPELIEAVRGVKGEQAAA